MPQPALGYPEIIIKNHHERRLLTGHQWAFSNELSEVRKDIPPGSIIKLIREFDKKAIAVAFYHPNSLISARIVSRDTSLAVNSEFIEKKIVEASSRREFLRKERNAIRLVHSESDQLPGLVIEQYNDIITFQIVSAGMENFKSDIVDSIKRTFNPKSIIEKNSSFLRTLEGLDEFERIVYGSEVETEIFDGADTKYRVSLLEGQKTGFYLDQMENRNSIRRYITQNSSVLDLFCNEGGFALNSVLSGAKSTIAVDSSENALNRLKVNAEINGITAGLTLEKADCFNYLKNTSALFDLIILDPPSLAKSKKHIPTALKAYSELHRDAIRKLKPGGLIATASCSHNISRSDFLDSIRRAASAEKKSVVILEEHGAAADHPVLISMPETEYLKFFVLRII